MGTDLAPGFLIASPPLGDPNFDRTVVLLAAHGPEGALGFVVNRKAELKIGQILSMAGIRADTECDACPVMIGGPVQPSSGWVMARDLDVPEGAEAIEIGARVRVTRSKRAFELLADEIRERPTVADPKGRIVLLGYSGWGPGQVEREIAAGAWLPAPFEESVLFEVDAKDRWEHAYALQGITPASSMSMRTVGLA
jgi:putative transcriptional regulator